MTDRSCPFCSPEAGRVFYAGERVVGIWDAFPASPGHALLITRQHVAGGLFLRAGVNNVFDREVTNHLNARNPFTGVALGEPGRVLFTRISFRF